MNPSAVADPHHMKRLGIVGGIGPESTVVYYRAIFASGRERLAGAAPPIIINSIDVQRVLQLAETDPIPGLRDYLLSEIGALERAGASLALIAANTPHIVFDEVQQRSPIELVSIVEAAREAAQHQGLARLGLLGTKFTMQGRFYPDVFSRSEIAIVRPGDDEQAFIHDKYVSELLKNVFQPETRERILAIVETMHQREKIDGVLLAGTELPLLLTESSASGIPLLDTTRIHVAAAVMRAWG